MAGGADEEVGSGVVLERTSRSSRAAALAGKLVWTLLALSTLGAVVVFGVHSAAALDEGVGAHQYRQHRHKAKHTHTPPPVVPEHSLALRAPNDTTACDGLPPPVPGDVKLTHYPSGFVFTFSDDEVWRPMCVNYVSGQSASVMCRMLGFQGATSHHNARISASNVSNGLNPGVLCGGSETNVRMCRRDPDFDAGWSDCQKYPREMALWVNCYGDIRPSQSNDYQMDERFTKQLKHAAHACGSSGILTSIMNDLAGANDADYSHAPMKTTSSSSSDTNVGAIVGPIFAGLGLTAITAGAHAAAQNKEAAHQDELLRQATQQRWQPPPEFDKTEGRSGWVSSSRGGGGGGGSECGCTLLKELTGLAELHNAGVLTDREYSDAKAKVLRGRR